VVEMIVLAALAFAAFVVVGALAGAISVAFWILLLPLRVLGWALRGVGLLLALPLMLLFGSVGLMIFGFGALMFLVPVLPFALIAYLVWRATHKNPGASAVSA
jgi:hypothetical protein